MKKIVFVYILITYGFIAAYGQVHDVYAFSRRDGLPVTEMSSVVRDAYGRMWVSGTNGGVFFYDGKQFQALKDTSAQSLLNNLVELKTADNGETIVIWNGEKGMSLVRNGKIKHFRTEEYPILKGSSLTLSKFSDGPISGINQKGVIFQLDAQTDNFIEIGRVPIEGYRFGQFDYHPDSKTYYLHMSLGFTHKVVKGQLGGNWETIIQSDARIDPFGNVSCTQKHQIITQNANKIRRYDGQKWQEMPLPLPTKGILNPIALMEHHKDRFFLVLKKDDKRRQVFELDEDFKVLNSVIVASRSNFQGVEKDLAGNFWLATRDGLLKATPTFFNLFSRDADGMIADLHSIAQSPNGNMWFGSYSEGITRFDGERFYKHPKGTNPTWRMMPGSILHGGQILMNVENDNNGIVVFDGQKWAHYLKNVSAFFYITHLNDGRLALGSSGGRGLALQKEKGNRFQDSTDFQWIGADKGMKLLNVIGIAEDRLSNIWMGRPSQGIAVYDTHLDTAFTWLIQNAQTDFGAMTMTTDERGNVWFGTTKGVFLYKTPSKNDKTTLNYWASFNPFKDFEPIGKDLLSKVGNINALKIWRNKYLIIGSENGIFVLDLQAFYASNGQRFPIFKFDETNGFTGGSCEQNALWMGQKDNVWIGHDKGATQFDIKNAHFDTLLDPLSIDSLQGGLTTFYPKIGEKITLDAGEQAVKIYFNTPFNRFLTNNILIKYRLVGKTDWSELTTDAFVVLTLLQPATYTLEIVAVKNGLAAPPQYLTIWIPKIWYKNELFWLAFLLISGFIGFGLYRKQEQRKRAFSQLRVQAIANQLNPHFINNTLNMIQLKSRNDADAVDMIDRLSKNIQTVFMNTRNRKAYHTLPEEFNLVENYLYIQKHRFGDKLDFELPNNKIIAKLNTIFLPLMSLQIHCENAVEHGLRNQKQGGKVTIRLENDTKNYVHIIVEDNGIGRKKAQIIRSKGNQQGVKMLFEMAQITNRFNTNKISYRYEDDIFTNTEGVHFGTRVHLFFPIAYNYEPPE